MTALAATIDGVEEDDIGDSTCTDARRRLALGNATGRRRLDGSASVAFDITIEPSAVGDDGFSPREGRLPSVVRAALHRPPARHGARRRRRRHAGAAPFRQVAARRLWPVQRDGWHGWHPDGPARLEQTLMSG